MAVFVSASDESAGSHHRDTFFFGGWIGPEDDWLRFFSPAWRERVLDGPPAIPYLHMTDIRNREWCERYGLSNLRAEDRIDEALTLIDNMRTLYPIGLHVNAGHVRDRFATTKVVASTGSKRPFEPDYVCFLGYAFVVLSYISERHPDVERVDFLVERKNGITKYIREFHSQLGEALEALGDLQSSRLVGDLIPASKENLPLQAADLLCWFTARAGSGAMRDADKRRYYQLAHREGYRGSLTNDQISQIAAGLLMPQNPPEFF